MIAYRVNEIYKCLNQNFEKSRDEDMDDKLLYFWKKQAEELNLKKEDMIYFKKNRALLLMVLKITSRTKLTLKTLITKLCCPIKHKDKKTYEVALKLITFEKDIVKSKLSRNI